MEGVLLFFLFIIFIIPIILVIICSALGDSLGIRELYANALVKIFEWAAKNEVSIYKSDQDDVDASLRSDNEQSSGREIIRREHLESIESRLRDPNVIRERNATVKVIVSDALDFISAGIESIIEDLVTKRFRAEELASWNLLTRTSYSYQHINWKLTALWFAGFLFRYLILLPVRIVIFFIGLAFMVIITSASAYVTNPRLKKWINRQGMLTSMRICSHAYSCIVQFHDRENRAKQGGICVANHTSPVDVLILSCDNCYAMVGQKQGGILGFIQDSLSRSADHIWFERTVAKDRAEVAKRLKEHVDDPNKLPILIFPEGTCINNTSVMLFRKGSFEIGRTIYPIAMKYDLRLGDAFWNSSAQTYGQYLLRMMTSWAIICDVWYLPPMTRLEGESAIEFARRVKHAIAEKGGLVDLEWDGNLKRSRVPPRLIAEHQKLYWDLLSRKTSINPAYRGNIAMPSEIPGEQDGAVKKEEESKNNGDLEEINSLRKRAIDPNESTQ